MDLRRLCTEYAPDLLALTLLPSTPGQSSAASANASSKAVARHSFHLAVAFGQPIACKHQGVICTRTHGSLAVYDGVVASGKTSGQVLRSSRATGNAPAYDHKWGRSKDSAGALDRRVRDKCFGSFLQDLHNRHSSAQWPSTISLVNEVATCEAFQQGPIGIM